MGKLPGRRDCEGRTVPLIRGDGLIRPGTIRNDQGLTKGEIMTEPRAMTGRVELGNGEVRELAAPGRRLVARIIDVAILVVVLVILVGAGVAGALVADDTSGLAALAAFGGLAVFFVVALLYEVTLIASKGQTLGKMAMGVMVASAEDGGVPGWGKAIGRWALPNLLNLIPLIGGFLGLVVYLSLLWDDRRQGWHDKMGTTVVLRV